jgi:hypothetical protein
MKRRSGASHKNDEQKATCCERIVSAEREDSELRKTCIAGTKAYADALKATGYRLDQDVETETGEAA